MNDPDFSRMTPQAIKAYHEGIALVKTKLAACRQETPQQRSERAVLEGREIIRKRFGEVKALKTFSVPPRVRPVPKTAIELVLDRVEAIAAHAAARK